MVPRATIAVYDRLRYGEIYQQRRQRRCAPTGGGLQAVIFFMLPSSVPSLVA